jgi:molybdopterin/thiamine biosynthesis adenylyltransferase
MSNALKEHLEGFRTWLRDTGFEPDHSAGETWNGSIFVEWIDLDTGHTRSAEHKLSILLPPGFPYRAPIVVSKDEPPLAPSWHLSPEPVLSLCLWDSQTGWRPHFTAQRLLRRIEDWFCHYHTDSWPAESEVPDLHRYLERVGFVVIGDEWTPPRDEQTGRFTFWRYQRFQEMLPCLASCYEDGNLQLQIQETEKRLVDNLLLIKDDIKRLSGVWFRLSRPFVPPDTLIDLLSHIDTDLGMEKGWAARGCLHVFGHKLSDDGFPIALGYADNQGQERWLFLWAQLSATYGKGRRRFSWSRSESMSQVKLKSFQTAPARKEDLLRRSAYLSKGLGSCRVAIFGVGALGGSVAALLAKSGLGEIRLVDHDTLMPGNVIRHVCGLKWVGFKKTIAVEKSIHAHNPDCHVLWDESTWEVDKLRSYIEGCDVAIDATANSNFSLYLNELCIDCNQPVIFAAAYRRAAVGRVVIRRSSNDPCLACYSDAPRFWSEDEFPIIPADSEETFIEDGCGVVTEEAAALDVEAVANLAARVAVKIAQKRLGDRNLAILVNEPLAGASGVLEQPGLHWRANKPLGNCLICHG